MGEGPGGWHLPPSPMPLPVSHLAMLGVQTQGSGDSDHWEPEVPQSCCWEIKVRPNGCPPTPQSLAFGFRVGCVFLNLHTPLANGGAGPDEWC